MHELVRNRVLGWWAMLVCRRPIWVLLIAAAATAASIAITLTGLRYQSDRNALLSDKLDWNRRFLDWRSSFPGNEDFFIVVDAGHPRAVGYPQRAEAARRFVDDLGAVLRSDPDHIESAVWRFDSDAFSPKALRLQPINEFKSHLDQIIQAAPMLEHPTPEHLLSAAVDELRQGKGLSNPAQAEQALRQFIQLVDALQQSLALPPDARPSLPTLLTGPQDVPPQHIYLTTPNDRFFFIRVTPRKHEGALNVLGPAITAIRAHIDAALASHPGVDAGLTGIDVVEADETDAATRDSTISSIIASVLITLLLILSYHSWRTPLLAMVALGIGIAWSFGFLTLTIGHLQVISVVFTVMLLGLGIAYGIHLASHTELVRHNYPDTPQGFAQAMRDSFLTVGPGVITGAVTTAAAFCTVIFTDFTGVVEMGLIAAVGVMLCLLAMGSVFPALLRLFCPSHRHFVPMQRRVLNFFDERWVMPCVRRPWITLAVAALATAASLLAIYEMRFDYDLLALQPRGVPSVIWQQRVVEDGGQSIWSGVSIVDNLEQARQRKAELLANDIVADVTGIGLLFPDDEQDKLRLIAETRISLAGPLAATETNPGSPNSLDPPPDLLTLLKTIRQELRTAQAGLATQDLFRPLLRLFGARRGTEEVPATIRAALGDLEDAVSRAVKTAESLDLVTRDTRTAQLQQEYQAWRDKTARQILQALDPSPLTPADFPYELLRPYVADHGPLKGKFALEIHPNVPRDGSIQGPLDPTFLPRFIGSLRTLDPDVTGVIAQVYYSGHLIQHSYRTAGAWALLLVFLLVWLDFQSLRDAALSLVPVAVGFATTFGIMWLAGISVNPANIIVLPLMFGIGVDSGVHMLHRYHQNPLDRPLGLTSGTGKGITITSYTTMIGFGAMLIARHRGIASLGFVLTVGIGMTLLACWTLMPALLELRARRQRGRVG